MLAVSESAHPRQPSTQEIELEQHRRTEVGRLDLMNVRKDLDGNELSSVQRMLGGPTTLLRLTADNLQKLQQSDMSSNSCGAAFNEALRPENGGIIRQQRPEHGDIIRQQELPPVSQDRVAKDAMVIFRDLVFDERDCIQFTERELAVAAGNWAECPPLDWESFNKTCTKLQNQHLDLLAATQHPIATTKLSKLIEEQGMLARMWQHSIQTPFVVLTHRLPASHECTLAFLQHAYSVMGHLYETHPIFENFWVECLRKIAQMGMDIESKESGGYYHWDQVFRYWDLKLR